MTIFERYNIPMQADPSALEAAVWVYECLIKDLAIETVSTASFESKVRESFAGMPMSDALVDLLNDFLPRLWEIVDNSETPVSDTIRLFDWMGEIRSKIKDERDYQVRVYARENKPKAVLGDEYNAKKNDAEEIRTFANGVFTFLNMANMPVPATCKVKTMKDKSKQLDLSGLPRGNREGGAGRKTVTSNLRLSVDDTFYSDWTVEKVCHDILSHGTIRITVSSLLETLKACWINPAEGWDEAIILNGHAVTGTIVKSSDDDEDPADEDENDDDASSSDDEETEEESNDESA